MHMLIVEAVREGRVKLVKILLEGGVDPNYKTTDGESLLTLAIESDHHLQVKYQILSNLFKYGVNVNKKDKNGRTVLIRAVLCSNPSAEIVSLIIENGADLLDTDNSGLTAMDYAQEMNYENICKLLKEGIKSLENKKNFKLKNFILNKLSEKRNHSDNLKSLLSQKKKQEFDDVFQEQTENQELESLAHGRPRFSTISFPLRRRQQFQKYKPRTASCMTTLPTKYPTYSDPLKRKENVRFKHDCSDTVTFGEQRLSTQKTGLNPRPPKQSAEERYTEMNREKQHKQSISVVPRTQISSSCFREDFRNSSNDGSLLDNGVLLNDIEIDIELDDGSLEEQNMDDNRPRNRKIGSRPSDKRKNPDNVSDCSDMTSLSFSSGSGYRELLSGDEMCISRSHEIDDKRSNKRKMLPKRIFCSKGSKDSFTLPPI